MPPYIDKQEFPGIYCGEYVRQEIRRDVRQEIRRDIRQEIRRDVRQEIRRDIRQTKEQIKYAIGAGTSVH